MLLKNSRKTEPGAKQFLTGAAVRAAPFALLKNSRKTEPGAKQFLTGATVRAAPFALLKNSRKTEPGAKQFLTGATVRAAPFALLKNSRKTEPGAKQFLTGATVRAAPFAHLRWLALLLAPAIGLFAQNSSDWTTPFPPHHVVGNIYYVGSKGLASYLITTPEGHILINSSLETSVPLIRASVEKLGFRFQDVKILLISHAHWDHCAGSFLVKELTGAKYMVMDQDVPVIESGGKSDFNYGNSPASLYKPVKVDRVLHDGDQVKLGDVALTAHWTPGHTRGCTTWTMTARAGGKQYNVVIVGSPNVNDGYKLVDNTLYPTIADDYARMFRVLKSLPCDIFLGAHGNYYGMEAKFARMKPGAPNPFIDPDGYKKYIADKEQEFRADLEKQKAN